MVSKYYTKSKFSMYRCLTVSMSPKLNTTFFGDEFTRIIPGLVLQFTCIRIHLVHVIPIQIYNSSWWKLKLKGKSYLIIKECMYRRFGHLSTIFPKHFKPKQHLQYSIFSQFLCSNCVTCNTSKHVF